MHDTLSYPLIIIYFEHLLLVFTPVCTHLFFTIKNKKLFFLNKSSSLWRRGYLSYLFWCIVPTQFWGMAHNLATCPSHKMVLRARFLDPLSQSVAMLSDEVQSYEKYLHPLLLELYSLQIPKNFFKTFFKWQNTGSPYHYFHHHLLVHTAFRLKISVKCFKISILKYFKKK